MDNLFPVTYPVLPQVPGLESIVELTDTPEVKGFSDPNKKPPKQTKNLEVILLFLERVRVTYVHSSTLSSIVGEDPNDPPR